MTTIKPSAPTSPGAYARITGLGVYRPSRVITNEEVCTWIDSSDEWIQERSGIRQRRWSSPEETVVAMAIQAADKALSDAGVAGSAIDTVILATVSHAHRTPSAASFVAEHIGTQGAAFDISAACAGFSYALNIADSLIRSSNVDHVLVIGVEKLSTHTDITDRGTAFLFADGAGAVVVSRSTEPGIGPTIWGSDGSQTHAIITTHTPAGEMVTMQGQTVFRWAVYEIAKICQQALDAAGISASDLDVFVPHQANNRITDTMIKTLGLPSNVTVARDILFQGNTSAASIPLAMDTLRQEGHLTPGGLALFVGFGAGLVFAAQVVRLP